MKLSVVVSVLNSHEIVRRQLLYFSKMGLPDDVEIIYLDDGSDPPLKDTIGLKNLIIHPTYDYREWTVALARNMGARIAKGRNILMTDIDFIIPKNVIDIGREFKGHKRRFKRKFGILDEQGNFTQSFNALRSYGLTEERIKRKGTNLPPHPNHFIMSREVFWDMGGYDENKMNIPYPKCTDDGAFKARWVEAVNNGKYKDDDPVSRPYLYMFPSGQFCHDAEDLDFNPFNLFHGLTRKTRANVYWMRGRRGK